MNQVLLQLSGTKYEMWRKLTGRDEKIYWPGYLEQISLFVLGHQLTYNLGQSKGAGNLCWALKSRCGSWTLYSHHNDYWGKISIESLLDANPMLHSLIYTFSFTPLNLILWISQTWNQGLRRDKQDIKWQGQGLTIYSLFIINYPACFSKLLYKNSTIS